MDDETGFEFASPLDAAELVSMRRQMHAVIDSQFDQLLLEQERRWADLDLCLAKSAKPLIDAHNSELRAKAHLAADRLASAQWNRRLTHQELLSFLASGGLLQ